MYKLGAAAAAGGLYTRIDWGMGIGLCQYMGGMSVSVKLTRRKRNH